MIHIKEIDGQYYFIELRPEELFNDFIIQRKGGHMKRILGKTYSGNWETAAWLVKKDDAHITPGRYLVIDNPKAKELYTEIYGPIMQREGYRFKAIPSTIKPVWSIEHTL